MSNPFSVLEHFLCEEDVTVTEVNVFKGFGGESSDTAHKD